MDNRQAEPVLKWAGGKRQLLGELLPRIPDYKGKYIEPFIGGGALFFALLPENAILSDCNEELIQFYKTLRWKANLVIKELKQYKNNEEEYYKIRAKDWKTLDPVEAAARMIYLNKTCFNGLYRVNRQGKFNVPYGKRTNIKICNEDQILKAARALRKKKIICGDYSSVLKKYAEPDDFIFLDPPYFQVTEKETFLRYTSDRFYEDDQIKLAKIVNDLYDRGCNLLITNSNHPQIFELYSRFDIDVVTVRRSVNCMGDGRKGEDTIIKAFHRAV